MFTLDTGRTWSDAFTPDSSALYDLVFTDSLTGYAVGQSGTILKYDPTIVSIRERPPSRPSAATLWQNYPNPFNPSTVVDYQLSMDNIVTLKVYDLLGREVITLVEQTMPAGRHRIQWDGYDDAGNPAASGLYFYRLEATSVEGGRQSVSVKKMLLLR